MRGRCLDYAPPLGVASTLRHPKHKAPALIALSQAWTLAVNPAKRDASPSWRLKRLRGDILMLIFLYVGHL